MVSVYFTASAGTRLPAYMEIKQYFKSQAGGITIACGKL
jgi:hypothetical protein